jgi:hypothetical protein
MASKKRRRKRRPRAEPAAPRTVAATPAPAPKRATSIDERPPAPWGSFPLVELAVFVGLVMLVIGFVAGGDRGPLLIATGLVLASLGGLELAIREHFGGYRSHSALLAGIPSLGVLALLFYAGPDSVPPAARIGIAGAVFVAAAFGLASIFRRKAGVAVKLR